MVPAVCGATSNGAAVPVQKDPAIPSEVKHSDPDTQATAGTIQVSYAPRAIGDDVGTLYVGTSESPRDLQAGLTGGAQNSGTVLDQWDQSSPKVDLLIVIDNSGSMAEEQRALAANLDALWNRIAIAKADYHIAVTTTGMDPYTAGWSQCPGGA